jgi:hypothetical protein
MITTSMTVKRRMTMTDPIEYGPWKLRCCVRRPIRRSRWFYGNFTLGFIIDSHPRFRNFMLCLLVVEFGIGWTREVKEGYLRQRII